MQKDQRPAQVQNLSSPVYIGEFSPTPLGPIWIGISPRGLVAVEFEISEETFKQQLRKRGFQEIHRDQERTRQAGQQVAEYLAGRRQEFELEIAWETLKPFQQQVLKITYAIPYGQVCTYGDIARQVGKARGARAVGRAEATNPMPLVIPCHRVIGTDGGLHGYGGPGGIPTKAWLLRLEQGGKS